MGSLFTNENGLANIHNYNSRELMWLCLTLQQRYTWIIWMRRDCLRLGKYLVGKWIMGLEIFAYSTHGVGTTNWVAWRWESFCQVEADDCCYWCANEPERLVSCDTILGVVFTINLRVKWQHTISTAGHVYCSAHPKKRTQLHPFLGWRWHL